MTAIEELQIIVDKLNSTDFNDDTISDIKEAITKINEILNT